MADKVRGFELVRNECRKFPTVEVPIPVKATPGSAGYDFYSPIDIDIPPQTKVSFRTDIKAYMQPDEVLLIFTRSSIGIKHNLELANSVGVGDMDFYSNEGDDGNYSIVLFNRNPEYLYLGDNDIPVMSASGVPMQITVPVIANVREENTVHIHAGDRIMQGVFFKTLPADSDRSLQKERIGGIGSTSE